VIYHFVGVGGIGMSPIARILRARNVEVSGSDVAVTPLIEQLRGEGVNVMIGHEARNVRGADVVVVSSAIDRGNPEYLAAVRAGTPVLHRGEMLARLLSGRRGIAVCGTHGKTTTTAMAHAVLRGGGIDAGLALGGIDVALATNAYDGTSPWFVMEADESDGSFVLLEPNIAIVTNIENDHLTSDDELPGLVRAFGEFLAKLPDDGLAIVGIDNALAASLTGHEFRGFRLDVRGHRRRDGARYRRDARAGSDERRKCPCRAGGGARVRPALRLNRRVAESLPGRTPPVRHLAFQPTTDDR
jgi:UDP-N-acetylmuramate--alanine ligase